MLPSNLWMSVWKTCWIGQTVCQRENIEWNRACDPVTRSSLFSGSFWIAVQQEWVRAWFNRPMMHSFHMYMFAFFHIGPTLCAQKAAQKVYVSFVLFLFYCLESSSRSLSLVASELYFPHNNFLALQPCQHLWRSCLLLGSKDKTTWQIIEMWLSKAAQLSTLCQQKSPTKLSPFAYGIPRYLVFM